MDTRGPHTHRPVQYSFKQALTVSGGTVVVVFVAMVALSYPAVALGAVLGGLAMTVGRRARRWVGGLRTRLGRYTASKAGGGVSEDDPGYNVTVR